MKLLSFFFYPFVFLAVVVAIQVFSAIPVFASCGEVTCASDCGTQIEVTNACKTEKGCKEKACIPSSQLPVGCENFNTQCAVNCVGEDDAVCSNVACPTGTKYCKTGTSAGTCSGGSCKATCATGETEDTTCSTSQCSSNATDKKYCKTGSGGGGTTTEKCDPAKFKEYAGVCFPINTGLSELGIIDIVVNLMKWMLYLFGFLAIISFVVSGIQYLAASGNASMIETAKRNMTYSIVGVIVALAGLVIIIAIDALLKGTAWGG